jgi:hypothetical protein
MKLPRRSLLSGAGICALVIGVGMAAPVQAHAATSAPSTDGFLITYSSINFNNMNDAFSCIQGFVDATPGLVVKSLENLCGDHIYLQYPGGVHPFCVSANSTRSNIGTEYQQPTSIQIGPGTSAC